MPKNEPRKPDAASPLAAMKHVVKLSSNIGGQCACCSTMVGAEHLEEGINHYIQEHGYTLLHVGTEDEARGAHGEQWHFTVAILGSTKVPPPKPPVEIRWIGEKPERQ